MIRPSAAYPGQIDTSDLVGYPHGKAQNVTVAGDGLGTPLEKDWLNDVFGFFAALLASAGITPSNTPDKVGASDLLDAIDARIATTQRLVSIKYRLEDAVATGVSLDVSGQALNPSGFAFSADGTKLYVCNASDVYQYALTTPFDLSTASYESKSFDLSNEDTNVTGVYLKSDGTKLYACGSTNDRIYQYSLSTALDVSTASYDSVSLLVSSQDASPVDFSISKDGTKLFLVGSANEEIFRYSMTAWDLSTASYDSQSFDPTSENIEPRGIAISSDGTIMFVLGAFGPETVFKYTLSTPFDVSTASYDGVSFDISDTELNPTSIRFSDNGSKMYLAGVSGDAVLEFYTNKVIATL